MFDSNRNPYLDMIQSDFYQQEDMIQVDLSEDSVTRRLMEYDQNDLLRYVARKNPLGSEKMFLEDRGNRLGESVYSAFEDTMSGVDEVYVFDDSTWTKAGEDPREVACEVVFTFKNDMNQVFYEAAMESIEEYAFQEGLRVESEI